MHRDDHCIPVSEKEDRSVTRSQCQRVTQPAREVDVPEDGRIEVGRILTLHAMSMCEPRQYDASITCVICWL